MYAEKQREIEVRMAEELSYAGLSAREMLIIKSCSVVATQEVIEAVQKERREFRRDLESIRESVDLAQELGQAVTRALRY